MEHNFLIIVKAKGGKTGTLGFGERALKLLNDYLVMRDTLFPQTNGCSSPVTARACNSAIDSPLRV
jgi:site-specific recombinase XerD